jgi:pimeloyl-ACP methyl ester carboxylesterase
MITLPPAFRAIAPDLRGYGLSDRSALIDATRGVQDWVDDLYALLVSVDRFHLVGHSLGGLTSWGVMADSRASGRLRTVTVVAPGPPCGFGGVHGESGLPNNPDFAGSGGGLVHPRFRVLTTSARKPPLRTDKFAALGRIAAPVHPIRR